MIVVDASAVLAIYLNEPERAAFLASIITASNAEMSPVNFWEVLARAHAIDGAEGRAAAESLIASLNISITRFGANEARLAVDAFERYGRRTPAGLNLGDCCAYALAKSLNAPLLFKGDDFTKTDISVA